MIYKAIRYIHTHTYIYIYIYIYIIIEQLVFLHKLVCFEKHTSLLTSLTKVAIATPSLCIIDKLDFVKNKTQPVNPIDLHINRVQTDASGDRVYTARTTERPNEERAQGMCVF